MKLDEEYIKSLPLTTNKINVIFDREVFFSRYSIVSSRLFRLKQPL